MICVYGCIAVAGLLSLRVARAWFCFVVITVWLVFVVIVFFTLCCADHVSSVGKSPPGILVKMCDWLRQNGDRFFWGIPSGWRTAAKGTINELCFEVSLNIAGTVSPLAGPCYMNWSQYRPGDGPSLCLPLSLSLRLCLFLYICMSLFLSLVLSYIYPCTDTDLQPIIFSAQTPGLLSLMSYDLHRSWESVTGHHSGSYAHSSENGPQSFLNAMSHFVFLILWCTPHLFEARNV